MRLRLDPWPADYEAPVQIDETAPAEYAVDASVETSDWRAVPADPPVHAACCFVDGVRRVEARVIASGVGPLVHGLFGSLASGCVRVSGSRAEFENIEVERYLVLGLGQHQRAEFRVGGAALKFEPYSTEQNTPNAVLGQLQSLMQMAEARKADAAANDDRCVFVDGLSYRATAARPVAGVIKRILEMYLPAPQFALVESLAAGERTPLFAIKDTVYERYSCFLRLAAPRPVDHPLAGVVRIEIGSAVGIDRAVALASTAAALLPRFASTPARDPRAPQNLLPVGSLESEMRRRLGDPVTIRRAIEASLHKAVSLPE